MPRFGPDVLIVGDTYDIAFTDGDRSSYVCGVMLKDVTDDWLILRAKDGHRIVLSVGAVQRIEDCPHRGRQ